jgi:hypothetical protein
LILSEKAIRAALSKGDEGMDKIATRFRVGTGTVQRIKAEMAERLACNACPLARDAPAPANRPCPLPRRGRASGLA